MASESVSRRSSELKLKLAGRFFRRAMIVVLAGSAAVAAIWWWKQQSPINRGNKALNAAYRFSRPLEERISGFDYARFAQVRGEEAKSDNLALIQAERFFLDAASDRRPKSLHALGRFYLAQGKLKEAGDQFELALQWDYQNAQLHNDQAVLLMAKSRAATGDAESGEEIEQLAIALEHFNRALELNPNLPEAVFNRALLYSQMLLPQQAREAWLQSLRQDSASHWADEARQYLKRLDEPQPQVAQTPAQLVQSLCQAQQHGDDEQAWNIISKHRDQAGSVVISELLDNYLASLTIGDQATAVRLRETLLFAGAIQKRIGGDRFINDLASFYSITGHSRRADLVQARDWLKSGVKQLNSSNIEGARTLFAQARQMFNRVGNVGEALQAEFLLGKCYRKQSELVIRSNIYQRLAQVSARSQYKLLLTQTLIAQSEAESGLANYSNVIEYSRQGLRVAQAVGDTSSCATFLIQAADSYNKLGDHHQSLKLYHDGLTQINRYQVEPFLRWALYMSISLPLNSLGRHTAAVEYQRESLRIARAIGSLRQVCRSHVNLALTYGFQRNYEEATKNAQLAFDLAQGIPDGYYRTEHLALASLKLGQLYIQAGDFAKARQNFDRALQLYDGLDYQQAFTYVARKGKLIAALAQGETSSLDEEIKTVLELFEKYRVRIREENNRNSFFDVEQSVYDIAINYWHTEKNDTHTAFELAERSRARSLLDLVTAAPRTVQDAASPDLLPEQVAPPLALAEIQARLPKQTQLVQYAVLQDKLLIWVISSGHPPVVRERKISSTELSARVTSYLQMVAKPSEQEQAALQTAARQLYSLLIEPVAPLLDSRKQLCLVPDKMLSQLPYAALVSPESGRFLIEDYSVIFAPSATMFIVCSDAAAAKERVKVERLLSVGDPAFDRHVFALPYLLSARQEANAIASYYSQQRILTDVKATKRRLAEEIGQFDVLHLALHCVVDERSPMHSKLLLAKPKEDSGGSDEAEGVLRAYEIYRLPLSRLRLVVLAACRSGVERYYGGEGMVGISRPFIARKIPLVIASLWEVDSPATSELMIRFHQYRQRTPLFTTEALRQAQLDLLRQNEGLYRAPYYWASFVSIGGYAGF